MTYFTTVTYDHWVYGSGISHSDSLDVSAKVNEIPKLDHLSAIDYIYGDNTDALMESFTAEGLKEAETTDGYAVDENLYTISFYEEGADPHDDEPVYTYKVWETNMWLALYERENA